MRKTEILNHIRQMQKDFRGNDAGAFGRVLQYLVEQFGAWRCERCGGYFTESSGYIIWKRNPSGYSRRMEVCARCCKKINKENDKLVSAEEEELKQDLGMLRKPCDCGSVVTVYQIESGNYKGVWVAACPKCDIEYYFENDGKIHVVS
jgi:uncharacterized C2H2 Zn-finger protein